jgi:hypothetical protein
MSALLLVAALATGALVLGLCLVLLGAEART